MGMTSIHNSLAGWYVRLAVRTPLRRQLAQARSLNAEDSNAFHQALHTAYRVFVSQYPAWTQRGFDESFLRTDAVMLLISGWVADGAAQRTPTGMDLARLWERKYGMLLCGADRVTQVVQLASAANVLLAALVSARSQQYT